MILPILTIPCTLYANVGPLKSEARNEQAPHADNKMISSYWGFLDQYGPHNQGGRRRGVMLPGGVSPIIHTEDHRNTRLRGGPLPGGIHQSMYGGLHHRPQVNMAASTASVLLDPHHMPPPQTYQRRQPPGTTYQHPSTQSVMEESIHRPNQYVSNLGDPFMSTRLSATVDADEEDPEDKQAAAGVLGLLNQFQRVQNNGGRGGVNI